MHEVQHPPILDGAATLADGTRCRILRLTDGHELSVSELCTVLQLPQSTISRHLKILGEGGWVRARREGTSHYYRLAEDDLEPWARQLWQLVREQVVASPAWDRDAARLESVISERRTRSQEFFASTGGEWDRLRDELFGDRFDLLALADLLDPAWVFGDLACGTGRLSRLLAPAVDRVVAVDSSPAMLEAAETRLGELEKVELREGRLERLPLRDGSLDAAAIVLGLAYVAEPTRALEEAHRVLGDPGRLLIVDLLPHDREELRREMGHAWLGFSRGQVEELLQESSFEPIRVRPLPPDPEAKGPALFAASATKTGAGQNPDRGAPEIQE
ncbi:MAG: metalloregulator ArsR/SmtB family transcription factor [Thermoanaerobaculia bacterium]|nr:metalloregulator ArsR/SmtB family transcription factor [Thermoanaerobaculia bacterium]